MKVTPNSITTASKLGALFSLVFTATAVAVPISIYTGIEGGSGDTMNVLFNDPGLSHSGTTVEGNFNSSDQVVNFTSGSGNGNLVGIAGGGGGGGGQARVAGGTGNDPFTDLTFELASGDTFTKAIMNLDATVDGNVEFTVSYILGAGSPHTESFSLNASGQNFFTIIAGDGARITQVNFNTDDSAFLRAIQFRIGVGEPGVPVPDGATTVMLLGLGLASVGAARRFVLR